MTTTPEFLEMLRQVRDLFEWTLTADTGRETERRSKPRFHLRATPYDAPSLVLGPLHAVVYAQGGGTLNAEDWVEAAEALQMELPAAASVVAAASDQTWTGEEGKRNPEVALLGTRRLLLEAVGMIASARGVPEQKLA